MAEPLLFRQHVLCDSNELVIVVSASKCKKKMLGIKRWPYDVVFVKLRLLSTPVYSCMFRCPNAGSAVPFPKFSLAKPRDYKDNAV